MQTLQSLLRKTPLLAFACSLPAFAAPAVAPPVTLAKTATGFTSLLQQGRNTLQPTVPAGPVANGAQYDYLRLELDESAPPPATK